MEKHEQWQVDVGRVIKCLKRSDDPHPFMGLPGRLRRKEEM